MLFKCQESCIINGGNTTKYFKLQKGARQGDPVSAYLQKQPFKGVLRKSCSENMQQIFRRTPMPISMLLYLFILCLAIVFILIKTNGRLTGINNILSLSTLTRIQLTQTFFLRDKRSITELINIFATFSKYSGLKANHEKYEIAGIGVLKSVKVVVCGMKCIDLCNDNTNITKSLANAPSYI